MIRNKIHTFVFAGRFLFDSVVPIDSDDSLTLGNERSVLEPFNSFPSTMLNKKMEEHFTLLLTKILDSISSHSKIM